MANFLRRLVAKSRSSSPQKQPAPPQIPPHHHSGIAISSPTSHHAFPPSSGYIPGLEEEEPAFDWGPSQCSAAAPKTLGNHLPPPPPTTTLAMMGNNNSSRHHHAGAYGPSKGATAAAAAADGIPPQFLMNSLNKAPPTISNHVGHHSSQQHATPKQHHHSSPTSNRRSPPGRPPKAQSPATARRQQFSVAQQFSGPDEPGTSSQELLSPSLWPSSPAPTPCPWPMRNSHSNPDSAASSSQRPSSSTQAVLTRLDELSSIQTLATTQGGRPRSSSPRKPAPKGEEWEGGGGGGRISPRSRSPAKKSTTSSKGTAAKAPGVAKTLDYLQAQCRLEGCSAIILVEETRFLVCKHQLSHSSDFFRTLFLNSHALPMEGVRHVREDEYVVQVSSLRHPPQALQFQWFLETTVPSPMLRDISDDLLETCMRLCKRFAARGLEMRCTKFIKDNVEAKPPLMALCWLNWAFKHHFHRSVQEACLPAVARLSLCQLEKHRQMLPEAVFADLLAMKLRTSYQQASTVFHTIHRMDHFHVDMPQCPRCGRQREQGRVRVQASPCHKLVGCERCMRDYQCELGDEAAAAQMQAYWQCEHGLWPFSEKTEDCRCQIPLYKANWASLGGGTALTAFEDSSGTFQQQTRPNRPGGTATAGGGGGGGRFPSNLTLTSNKPSHSSRS